MSSVQSMSPIVRNYVFLLKDIFHELSPQQQEVFWMDVGENDVILTQGYPEKPTFSMKECAFER